MKKIVLATGIIVFSALLFGFRKANHLKSIVEQLTTRLNRIYGFDWSNLTKNVVGFYIDITLINPTQFDLKFNTGTLITIKKVLFYNSRGELFAIAETEISNIEIPANENLLLQKLPMQSSVTNGIKEAFNFINGSNNSNIKIALELEALEQKFTTSLN